MTAVEYIKRNWDKAGVVILSLIAALCIGIMVLNLYQEVKIKELPSGVLELKPLTPIISHSKYESLAAGLKEPYHSKKAHVRNIFARYQKGKEPPEVRPVTEVTGAGTIPGRFRVVKIYRKPVELLFKGYIQLADGAYVATINWGGKTDFKRVGEDIRGYKVVDFKKDVSERKTPWGGTEKVDKSIVTLERSKGERFNLIIGYITLEKEIFAEINDCKEGRSYDVHIGSEILGYKILDISPGVVIIGDSSGEKVQLRKGK